MITIEGFIKAMQNAILSANDALMAKNQELLDKFFEPEESNDESTNTKENLVILDDVLKTVTKLGGGRKSKDYNELQDKLFQLKGLLEYDDSTELSIRQRKLRPKTVVLSYPSHSVNGKELITKDVVVPLITLVPLTMSKIEEVKLSVDIELYIIDNQINIGFGKKLASGGDKNPNNESTTIGHLEIIMGPNETPEGLKKIIEGYERMLRAQIPN
jgi:hypothetical protein